MTPSRRAGASDLTALSGEVIARGLEFPEGPVWLDGTLCWVEMASGCVSRMREVGKVEPLAHTAGGPNGAALGPDGALYVTQNGGMRRRDRVPAALQRVGLDGEVETLTTEVAGYELEGPNDLAFGPDGRIYFTDPRGAADPKLNFKRGRLFAWDPRTERGELLLELDPVFPNGIAFDSEGALLWTESFSRRVMALRGGRVECLAELPERHFPDGLCVGADGRLYVAATFGHCVAVIESGKITDRLVCGDGMVTNCCFGGADLYVTESRHGTLWRFDTGIGGLALHGRSGPETGRLR